MSEARPALAELQRVTDAALAFLTLDELLAELLERIAAILRADTAAILLIDENGDTLRARAARGVEEEVEQGFAVPVGRGFAGRIAAERRSISIADADHADILHPIVREKGIRSLLGVPLMVEGRVLGVLHVGTLVPRAFTDDDRDLLQLAGDRAALAIDHARLYHAERRARRTAEQAAATLEAIQSVTDAALAYLPLEELLAELLERITRILHADTAAILLLDEERQELVARAAKGIEEEVERGVRIPLGAGFAGRVAAQRTAIAIPDIDRGEIFNPILRARGIRSLLGVPLLVEGRVIGVLHVGALVSRDFTDDDRNLLQLAGDRAALAIEHARLYEQRRLAEVLQRSLLPRLPDVPGVVLAARYLPATAAERLGGDWYDVFELSAGRLGLAIGDVVGRGVAAAALMAQLRTALRAYALDGHGPAAVVERLNRLLAAVEPGTMTTLAYGVLDVDAESLLMASAGHIPPVVASPGADPVLLPVAGDPPLGVSPVAGYREQSFRVPTGSTLVLVTDGAVEVRGESLDQGLERLRRAAARHAEPEALCHAIASAARADGSIDDVAALVARIEPLPARMLTTWPADAHALARLRHLLGRWLRAHGADDDEIYDITLACQEACANAVEHAYGPADDEFEVEALHRDSEVVVTVSDRGSWRDRGAGVRRGRGLRIMESLVDTVEVRRAAEGTTVVLRRSLGGGAAEP